MKRFICLSLCIILLLSLCACAAKEPETPVFSAGFGRERVMPDNFTSTYLGGGDSSSRQTEGFLDYLYVTCIAIRDADGETALIYTMDI